MVTSQIKRAGAVALARAAVSRPSLELLAIDENMVSEDGLDEVRRWTRTMKCRMALPRYL